MQQAIHNRPPTSGGRTIAEGIAVKTVGKMTKPVVEAMVSDVLAVGEEALECAVQLMLSIEKAVVEGAGAATLAALLANRERFEGRKVGLIVSGGNIDLRLLSSVILKGLVRDGRIVRMRIEISDIPGTLARIATIIGEADANIIEVYHQRAFSGLPAKNAELDVVIETRGGDHVGEIIEKLTAVGFRCTLLGQEAASSPL